MNWQFPVHITGTRATISMLIIQGKKCNQSKGILYVQCNMAFPVMEFQDQGYKIRKVFA